MKIVKSNFFVLIVSVLIISLFLINYFSVYYKPESVEVTLGKYFTLSKAKIISSEMYFWGSSKGNNEGLSALKKMAEDFSKDLGVINGNITSKKTNNNDLMQRVELNGKINQLSGNATREIKICIKVDKQEVEKSEKTISIDITQDLSMEGFEKIKVVVLKAFEKHKIKPKSNSCIAGVFDGKMNIDKMIAVGDSLINDAGGKKVEDMQDKNLVSMTAYSPQLEDTLIINGKKVNLSIAMRFNSIENRTYIWLATPVITTEY